MKSYLSLVPISAKVRKRQNRMTILCVIISIFLVTAIFSVADMMIRTQSDRMTGKNGSWHIELDGISQETALKIAERDDVVSIGAVTIFNPDGELPYRMDGKRVVLYGIDESYLTMNSTGAAEGRFPQGMGEIMLSSNAARVLQVAVGDTVTLRTPSGDWDFTVSGLGGVEESYYSGQYSLMDAYLPRTAFAALMEQNNVHNLQTSYYVQFTSASKAAKAIPELTAQHNLPENAVSENTGVMAIAGQSDSSAAKNVYSLAAVLFVLVLLAGVLMISGSMNSNLAQRIQFFGMMRCIGMSKSQIIRFVRLEALNWCKTAVPVGVLLGTLASWSICAALHYGIGGEFSTTPVFQISPVGLVSGIVVGIVTVLLAAESPARRAARVSPVAAVSGTGENLSASRHASNYSFGKIELSLGAHHAIAGKKNLFLMTSSFALSIVLVLCFSVLLKFAGLLLPGQAPWQPDILLNGYGNEQVLSRSMAEQLRAIPGVGYVWGATGLTNTPASSPQKEVEHCLSWRTMTFAVKTDREILCQLQGSFLTAQSKEAGSEINHISVPLTGKAMEPPVHLHAGMSVIVKRTTGHPVPSYWNPIKFRSLSCRDRLLYCFKYIRFPHLQTKQKAPGFLRKSDALQLHILFFCRGDPPLTFPSLPVLPVSVQFAFRQLLFDGFSGFFLNLLFASLLDLRLQQHSLHLFENLFCGLL